MKEVSEIVEDIKEEIAEEVEEVSFEIEKTSEELEAIEEVFSTPKEAKKLKKHDQAKELVVKAKTIVKEAEDQMESCKLLLADDLKAYDEAKQALKDGGMDASEELLSKLDYVAEDQERDIEDDEVVFEKNEDETPMYLRDVSSGRFTGFILSLLGGVATLGGLIYYATKNLGVTPDITKVPSNETLQTLFGWFGTQIGRPDDAVTGGIVVAAVVLAVMAIIYILRVALKGGKNLNFATKQLEKAEEYTVHKGNCKDEMDKVDAHIHDSIKTLKTYEILLNEQKGKLQRIFHLEHKEEEEPEYHVKSLAEMKDAQELIGTIKDFMTVPMSEEGKLSQKSSTLLERAKNRIEKTIERLY